MSGDGVILPKYAGIYEESGSVFTFTNTCPLDTWFTILRHIDRIKLFSSIQPHNVYFKDLITKVFDDEYNTARIVVAQKNGLKHNNQVYSFYGQEFDLFIRPFLLSYYESFLNSQCNSPFCPSSDRLLPQELCPSFIEGYSIERAIADWFRSEGTGICGMNVSRDVPDEYRFEDESINGG